MAKNETKNAIAVSQADLPAEYLEGLADEAGMGSEGLTQDDLSLPFLRIIQSLSPQLDEQSPSYVEGATEGMLVNTATGATFDSFVKQGAKLTDDMGVYAVFCSFENQWAEWVPQDAGGGLVQMLAPNESPPGRPARQIRFESEAGNEWVLSHQHFCIVVRPGSDDPEPVMFPLSGTQLKHSKAINTAVVNFKVENNGKKFNPPRYAQLFRLWTERESNDKGRWVGLRFEHVGLAPVELYKAAKEFHETVVAGDVKVDRAGSVGAVDEDPGEDTPF